MAASLGVSLTICFSSEPHSQETEERRFTVLGRERGKGPRVRVCVHGGKKMREGREGKETRELEE